MAVAMDLVSDAMSKIVVVQSDAAEQHAREQIVRLVVLSSRVVLIEIAVLRQHDHVRVRDLVDDNFSVAENGSAHEKSSR